MLSEIPVEEYGNNVPQNRWCAPKLDGPVSTRQARGIDPVHCQDSGGGKDGAVVAVPANHLKKVRGKAVKLQMLMHLGGVDAAFNLKEAPWWESLDASLEMVCKKTWWREDLAAFPSL